ncbi:MAG: hypothetical protein WC028_23670 [Candidatus Obscuribacterales bacterium]
MFNFFTHARADPVSEKPGLDDFNSGKVARAVQIECLTHIATIIPFAVSLVALFWTFLIAASMGSVALFFAGIFTGTSAYIWNYFVNGENRVNAHYAKLMAERRSLKITEFQDFIRNSESDNFDRGAAEGRELLKVFNELMTYIAKSKRATALNGFRFRAEAAFEQGCSVLEHAYEVFKALHTVDVKTIQAAVTALEEELKGLTDDDDKAMQNRQIEAHRKQLDFYHKKEKQLKELLTLVDEIEAALQTTYLGLLELGSEDPIAFLSEDGDAAKQLVSAFEAAQRVEARLRGKDENSATANEEMQKYIAAAE